jgi:hypothetical protein
MGWLVEANVWDKLKESHLTTSDQEIKAAHLCEMLVSTNQRTLCLNPKDLHQNNWTTVDLLMNEWINKH